MEFGLNTPEEIGLIGLIIIVVYFSVLGIVKLGRDFVGWQSKADEQAHEARMAAYQINQETNRAIRITYEKIGEMTGSIQQLAIAIGNRSEEDKRFHLALTERLEKQTTQIGENTKETQALNMAIKALDWHPELAGLETHLKSIDKNIGELEQKMFVKSEEMSKSLQRLEKAAAKMDKELAEVLERVATEKALLEVAEQVEKLKKENVALALTAPEKPQPSPEPRPPQQTPLLSPHSDGGKIDPTVGHSGGKKANGEDGTGGDKVDGDKGG